MRPRLTQIQVPEIDHFRQAALDPPAIVLFGEIFGQKFRGYPAIGFRVVEYAFLRPHQHGGSHVRRENPDVPIGQKGEILA